MAGYHGSAYRAWMESKSLTLAIEDKLDGNLVVGEIIPHNPQEMNTHI